MAPRPPLDQLPTSRTASRPLSAQSTHSTDSNATQPLSAGPQQQQQHPHVPPQLWPHQHVHMQYQPHLINQHPHPLAMMDQNMQHFQHPMNFAQANFSFDRLQSPAVSSVEGELAGSIACEVEDAPPKKKGSGASQANDQELRRLFRENDQRSLNEVASEVKREEKGPKAEKSKQVFGMLWLAKNIKKSNQSVPRNRVYSQYATRCGDDNLPLLNPASFGKLVRIIFPNIQTRRLGVRGESKYHYVNLSLVNDDGRGSVPPTSAGNAKPESTRARTLSIQPQPVLANDKAFFPGFESPAKVPKPTQQTTDCRINSLYLQHTYASAERIAIPTRKDIMGRALRWPDATGEVNQDGNLELPRIDQYLPPGTDLDAANSLAAVYRSHCLQAIENFRFCKTDAFCDTFKTLVGLLTVPSQKLLAHPSLAKWIEACDKLKYQRMVPLLRNILLASVPVGAMKHMDQVARQMCAWITQYFSNQPPHVLEAMLRPASTFVSILSRFIRVNRTAHDVASIFSDDDTRDALWSQWVRGSQPLQVVEGTCDPLKGGHHRVLSMLTHEACFVLRPTTHVAERETNGLFLDGPWHGQQTSEFLAFKAREEELANAGMEGPLFSRLVRFVEDIPKRFPGAQVREILLCAETALGIAGRNMALNETGQGLSQFWTVSLFIAEMLYWLAEIGGFLEVTRTPLTLPNNAYSSPYETVSGQHSGATAPSGPGSNMNSTPSTSHEHASAQINQQEDLKMARLEEHFQLASDSNYGAKARVSLGGETMVGDDDLGTLDWGLEIKDPNGFFNQETSNVTVR